MFMPQVLVRGRLQTVRGKGKSAFLVIRQRTATFQVGVDRTQDVNAEFLHIHLCSE